MDRLWTPWRREFIEGAGATARDECFLCTKPAEHDDRANLILWRGERAYVLMNLYPYNSGHLLVAPYAHTGDYAALDAAIAADMTQLTEKCVAALQRVYRPDASEIVLGSPRSSRPLSFVST